MKKTLLIFALLSVSCLSKAEFKSKNDLIQSINRSGVNRLVVTDKPDLSNVTISNERSEPINLQRYLIQNGASSIKELNINQGSLLKKNYKAYNIANTFICYTDDRSIQRVQTYSNFSFCLSASENVDQILEVMFPSQHGAELLIEDEVSSSH